MVYDPTDQCPPNASDELPEPIDAPLSAYLEIAQHHYMEDDLDLAMQVIRDAFENAGWYPGPWTGFFNELRSEKEARDAAAVHRVDDKLTIEIPRMAPLTSYRSLRAAALIARKTVSDFFDLELEVPVIITIFLPDAPMEFTSGEYGYMASKHHLNKICLPYETTQYLQGLLHEFTHAAVHEVAGEDPPAWLNEGLAEYISRGVSLEGEHCEPTREIAEKEEVGIGDLNVWLNSSELRKDDPDRVSAAYDLAGTLVGYLIETYGKQSVVSLLEQIGNGVDSGRALRRVCRKGVGGLEEDWRSWLRDAVKLDKDCNCEK
jgi:hypothetical protein